MSYLTGRAGRDSAGDTSAATRRLDVIREVPELRVDDDTRAFAASLMDGGGVPQSAPADAVHIAVGAPIGGGDTCAEMRS